MGTSPPTGKGRGLREVFAAALECPSEREREALLARLGRSEPALRRKVEEMLEKHRQLDDFLMTPALGERETPTPCREDLSGTRLGPYELEEIIGEGGGGVVYLASQKVPVKRQVAVKILKTGSDSDKVIPRFEAERHTLALMEHPGIAKVLDAGTTEGGRPFFVMEYVAGSPVTEYCDRHGLPIRKRLEIFIKICRAIEHAHQKGIIHRDLKPSNILVREEDDRPIPKIIDFGVAKAMDPFEGAPLKLTLDNPIIGTPAYMSPEQAATGSRDIDTRADLYSLGVILFELLTGTTPLEAVLRDGEGTEEALFRLKEGFSIRPSSYVAGLSPPQARSAAMGRSSSARRLLAEIRGDLDWIVLTCLEKERDRRYGSSTELARDLELHLEGSPIRARPPSWRYRLGRFVGRNRLAVGLSALLVVALVATTVISYLSGARARRAEETEKELRLRAEEDRGLAVSMTREARLHQYVAHINLAHQAILNGHLSKARLLLERWLPQQSAGEDLRGFEWWYLIDRCGEDEHVALPSFGSPIDDLSFSSDGQLLAIASQGQVTICFPGEDRLGPTFPYDGRTVEFSKDRGQLLIAGREGVVVIDLLSESPVWELSGYGQSAAFSPDAPVLATGDEEGISLWNTDTWTRDHFFPVPVDSLLFSPQTGILAARIKDGFVLLDPKEEKDPVRINHSSPGFPGKDVFCFSPDGQFLVLAQNEDPERGGFAMALYDVETGREVALLATDAQAERHTGLISAVAFDREGKQLVSSSWDHSVRLWNFAQGTLARKFLGHRSEVWAVALSPDGAFVASGSKDGEVKLWPVQNESGESRESLIDGAWVPLAFSNDSRNLTAYHPEGRLATFELTTGRALNPSPAPALSPRDGRGVPVAQKGKTRVERGPDGIVEVTDLSSKSRRLLPSGFQTIDSLQLSPDGRWLAVTSIREGLRCWDLQAPAAPFIENEATTVLFSRDGHTLVSVERNGFVVSHALPDGRETSRWRLEGFAPGSRLALSPDGTQLAVTGGFRDYENVISLVGARSGRELGRLKGHKQGIWHLVFSPDGRTLASSGSGGVIRLWNVATQTELLTIGRNGTVIDVLSFSADGRVLVAGSPGFSKNPRLRIFPNFPGKPE